MAVRPDDLAADHARLPGPDRRLRQRAVRPALGHHRRAGRDGAGQGRRRRARRGRQAAAARASRSWPRTSTTPRTCRPPAARSSFEGYQPTKDAWHGRQAARGGRDHHRQGQPVRVRQRRPLLARRAVRAGVERVRAVEVVDRLLRRLRRGRRVVASRRRRWAPRPATRCGARRRRASLVSLRGTDGMQSTDGVMPLTYVQDYAGVISRSLPDLALLLNATTIDASRPIRSTTSANGHRPADWTPVARDATRCRARSSACPPRRSTTRSARPARSRRDAREFAHFVEAGATVKAITDPPSGPAATAGRQGLRGLAPVDPRPPRQPVHRRGVRSSAAPLRLPQFRNTSALHRHRRDDAPTRSPAFQAARAELPGRARPRGWTRRASTRWSSRASCRDIHLNDSIQPSASAGATRRRSAAGVPTVIFPAGVNDHGQPINLQLQGKEFDDDKLLGMAYAFEAKANGPRRAVDRARSCRSRPSTAGTVGGTVPATLSLTLGAPATFGAFTPGRGQDLHGVHDRQRDLHRGRRGAERRRPAS